MRSPRALHLAWTSWYRPLLGLACIGGAAFAVGLVLGLQTGTLRLVAAPPAQPAAKAAETQEVPSDYSRRIVARVNGNIEITREELGEWLIARYGAEKLELLVNRKIIEQACREKGITVTEAEVDGALDRDIGRLGVTREIFLKQVLKQYHTTLFEWREDVLKPQLLLTKLSQTRVDATEDDIQKAFEYHYGERWKSRSCSTRRRTKPSSPGSTRRSVAARKNS